LRQRYNILSHGEHDIILSEEMYFDIGQT